MLPPYKLLIISYIILQTYSFINETFHLGTLNILIVTLLCLHIPDPYFIKNVHTLCIVKPKQDSTTVYIDFKLPTDRCICSVSVKKCNFRSKQSCVIIKRLLFTKANWVLYNILNDYIIIKDCNVFCMFMSYLPRIWKDCC